MSERALGHIERVVTTYPIEGADNIEMTQVLDFHVVTKKGEFKTGDLVVYIEVDSILPDGLPAAEQAQYDELKKLHKKATGDDIARLAACMAEVVAKNTRPEFEFLREKKFRIKCRKYSFTDATGNPTYSEGIIFPLSITPTDITPIEGLDLTEALGIVKVVEDAEDVATTVVEDETEIVSPFEDKLNKAFMRYAWYRLLKKEIKGESVKGTWPSFGPPESKETNIQDIFTKVKKLYGDDRWVETEKMEGQNISAYLHKKPYFFGLKKREFFGVCTHHRNLITDDGSRFWQTIKELEYEEKLRSIGLNIFCRGEHVGGKIQGNIYKFKKHDIMLFEIWNSDKKCFYNHDQFMEFCDKHQFNHVPVLNDNFRLPETVGELLAHSNGFSVHGDGKVLREGKIYRHWDKPWVTFKVRSPEYKVLHGK